MLSVAHVTRVTHGLGSGRGNENFPAPTHVHGQPLDGREPHVDPVDELATVPGHAQAGGSIVRRAQAGAAAGAGP